MNPKLIITADDFGASQIIDRGIINAIQEGLITSVACFANVDRAGFDRIKKLNENFGNQIDIGLHFNISSGPPLTNFPKVLSRKKDGRKLFKRLLNLNVSHQLLPKVKEELEAQVNRFENARIPIRHFSDHYGMISMFDKELCKCMLDVISGYNKKNGVHSPVRLPMLWSTNSTNPVLSKSKMKSNGRLGNFVRKWILDVEDEKFFQLFKPQLKQRVKQFEDSKIHFADYSVDQFFDATITDTVAFLKAFHIFATKETNKAIPPSKLSSQIVFEMMAHISDDPKVSEKKELSDLKKYWKINKSAMKKKKPFELKRLKELFVPVVKNEGLFQITSFSQIKILS